jgi:hypothetical protein
MGRRRSYTLEIDACSESGDVQVTSWSEARGRNARAKKSLRRTAGGTRTKGKRPQGFKKYKTFGPFVPRASGSEGVPSNSWLRKKVRLSCDSCPKPPGLGVVG